MKSFIIPNHECLALKYIKSLQRQFGFVKTYLGIPVFNIKFYVQLEKQQQQH